MAIQAFSQVIGSTVQSIVRPYEEAKRQRQYALYGLFEETVTSKDQFLPSLTGRVTHLAICLFLWVCPVLHVAMRHFEWDSGRQFCQVIEEGDLDQLDFFLQIGWNPNQNFRGKPLIFIAYEHHQLEVLKRLLEEPSCNSDVFYDGKTLLHLAAHEENTQLVDLLLSSGASANVKQSRDQHTPAFLAYLEGNAELALEMIDKGGLVSCVVDRRKKTLLNHAWEKKDFEMVVNLIKRGAKPSSTCPISHYEMLKCLYERQKDLIISQMIPAGWDVNQADSDGHTILELVVANSDWKFARALVQNGAHINAYRSNGSRIISFNQFQSIPEYYRDFLEDVRLLPKGREKCDPRNWLSSESYLHFAIPALVERARRENFNPLEKVYFMGSDFAMQRLACTLTYSEFINYLVALRVKYKRRIQVDWIINALYEVNPRHFRDFEDKTAGRGVEAPRPHVFLNSFFIDEFKKLGTLTEEERRFQGTVYTHNELERYLNGLVDAVINKSNKQGLPENQVERDELYALIDPILRQIKYHLSQPTVNESVKKQALIDLAHAGRTPHTWHVELYRIFCLVSGREYISLSFADLVMVELGWYRLELLKKVIYKGRPDEYKYALNQLIDKRAILAEPRDPEEMPACITRTQVEEENHFDQFYIPHNIVNAILQKRKKSQYFREYMIDYFRNVESKKWVEAPFNLIQYEISRNPNPEHLLPHQIQQLFSRHGVIVPQSIDGRNITIQSALDLSRFQACYQAIESGESEANSQETLPLGTAKMLESMGYLRLRNSDIFKRSFSRTLFERWVTPWVAPYL